MDLYTPGPQADMDVLQLWVRLCEHNDILSYDAELQILSVFLRRMQAPTMLLLSKTEDVVTFALWVEPQPVGIALTSIWVHQDLRQSIGGLRLVNQGLELVFQEYPSIMAYAGQPENAQLYEGFGMTRHEPSLPLGDRTVAVLSMTRAQWRAKHQRAVRSA